MTIKELINELQKFNDDLDVEVVMDGYYGPYQSSFIVTVEKCSDFVKIMGE